MRYAVLTDGTEISRHWRLDRAITAVQSNPHYALYAVLPDGYLTWLGRGDDIDGIKEELELLKDCRKNKYCRTCSTVSCFNGNHDRIERAV